MRTVLRESPEFAESTDLRNLFACLTLVQGAILYGHLEKLAALCVEFANAHMRPHEAN